MSIVSPATAVTVGRSLSMLGEMGVGQSHVQATIDDPIRRGVVAAAYRGEIEVTSSITPTDWAARELITGAKLAELGLPMFEQAAVEKAAEEGVGIYDRFVPSLPKETARKQLLKACEQAGIKLYTGNNKDGDWDGERLPLETGVFVKHPYH